jgi:hypothetical protein
VLEALHNFAAVNIRSLPIADFALCKRQERIDQQKRETLNVIYVLQNLVTLVFDLRVIPNKQAINHDAEALVITKQRHALTQTRDDAFVLYVSQFLIGRLHISSPKSILSGEKPGSADVVVTAEGFCGILRSTQIKISLRPPAKYR